jgi:hypothetical protein
MQQQAWFDCVFATQDMIDAGQHFVRCHICQEAKAPAVNAEQWHVMVPYPAAGIQHGTVAAYRNNKIGGSYLFVFEYLDVSFC